MRFQVQKSYPKKCVNYGQINIQYNSVNYDVKKNVNFNKAALHFYPFYPLPQYEQNLRNFKNIFSN